ncbi:MAG: response regulator [Agathobacter sp.]|nr:response regulator [Agathobacter sp.]
MFKVKDTGIGVAKEFQSRIFEAFERDKMTEQTGIQGTGLGLAITKNIVEMMGGRISIESELGKGTEFTVKVMFALQDVDEAELLLEDSATQKELKEKQEKEKQRVLFKNRKILLVEDNNLNREIARILLTEKGFIVEEAVNGQEAVEKVANGKDDEYALVLMDIQMPIMDGYEAAKEIRNMSNRKLAHIPIIAMTANAFEEEKKEALACGMNGYVVKPIDVNILFNTIEGILK